MSEFNFFEIWTGLNYQEIEASIRHLLILDDKLKLSISLQLVEYLYLYLSIKLGSFEQVQSSVLYRISKSFSPVERLFFRYIDHLLWGVEIKDFAIAPDILSLKEYVEQTHFSDKKKASI